MKTKSEKKFIPQFKVADMVSIVGAGLTGLSIGASMGNYLAGAIPVLIILGVVLLALGMYGKFEIEREHIDPPKWVMVAFGLCWIGLMLAALYLLIARYAVTV